MMDRQAPIEERLRFSGEHFGPRPDWKRLVRRRILAGPIREQSKRRVRALPAFASACLTLFLAFVAQTAWHTNMATEGEFYSSELEAFRSEVERTQARLDRQASQMDAAFAQLQASKAPIQRAQPDVSREAPAPQRARQAKARARVESAKKSRSQKSAKETEVNRLACLASSDPLCGL